MQTLLKHLLLLLLIFATKPVLATVVIFEAGFGQDEHSWAALTEQLPADFTLVTYTRQSLARPDAKPSSIAQDVQALINVIKRYQHEKVLLVGHSYGGLIVTEAAQLAPELIAGVVLLEPTVRSQRKQFRAIDNERIDRDDDLLRQYLPARLVAQFNLLMQELDDSAIDTYPLPKQLPVVLFTSTQRPADPLFFEETETGKQQWQALHQSLIANSEHALHIRSRRFGHNPHIDSPAMVASIIVQMDKQL